MNGNYLILLICFVIEVAAIAVVSVFGMTFIAKAYDRINDYTQKKWGDDISFIISCAILLVFLLTTLIVVLH